MRANNRLLTPPIRRWVARYPVATFLILAFGISITIALLRLQTNSDIQSPFGQYLPGFLEHLLSVALPAFLVVAAMHGKTGVLNLARRSLRWRAGVRWYLIALLGIPVATVLSASVIYGLTPLEALVDRWPLLFTLIVPDLLIRIVFLNLLEEIGWMGFLQARLQNLYGPWKACLLVEIPFALWHLPGLLGDTGGQLSSALFLLGVYAIPQLFGRVIMMWLYNNTYHSVLLVGLFHAAHNTTINQFVAEFIPGNAETRFLLTEGGIMVAAVLLLIFTKGRLSYKPNQADQPVEASHLKG